MNEYSILKSNEHDNETIHQMLSDYNSQYFNNLKDYSFHIDDENGEMIAGIVAGSTYSTLEIEFLFVKEEYRNQGLGKKLISYVEGLAKSDGIEIILLNTYSFQAPDFYHSLGYRDLFAVDPCFSNYKQYYLIKKL